MIAAGSMPNGALATSALDAGHLLRQNELLHDEVRALRQANTELTQRVHDMTVGMQADRAARRAALNLMEDAVLERRAKERENVERQRVEEQLLIADRRKDEFLAVLAHELRTPLAPIRNNLYTLRLAGDDHETAVRLLEMMGRQVDHMVRLVDDLMDLSRISRGVIQLCKERVRLTDILHNAVEISRPQIEANQHQLEIEVPDPQLCVFGDPVRLAQIFSNLLNNAAKYTLHPGHIALRAERVGAETVVTVRDDGMGISEAMLERIFDMFIQVEQGPGRPQGGVGIGLTLVRSLTEMHGGTVCAESDGLGRGSLFTVRLPLAEPLALPGMKDDTPHALERHAPRRVLVVDDNRDAAESLGLLLRTLGAEVQVVNEGTSALKAVQRFLPDVMLLDIGMPGMDGNEVASRLRTMPERKHLLLVALTGWSQQTARDRSERAGFDRYVVKPVDLNALQVLLDTPRVGP